MAFAFTFARQINPARKLCPVITRMKKKIYMPRAELWGPCITDKWFVNNSERISRKKFKEFTNLAAPLRASEFQYVL
jgi:hypothetical protein